MYSDFQLEQDMSPTNKHTKMNNPIGLYLSRQADNLATLHT